MFRYNPHRPRDMRYAVLDPADPRAKKILTRARAAARADLEPGDTGHQRALLRKELEKLDMGQLNTLAVMSMISSNFQGATGQGGIWAAASRLTNLEAREALKSRPAFEVVEIIHPDGTVERPGQAQKDAGEEHYERGQLALGLSAPAEPVETA